MTVKENLDAVCALAIAGAVANQILSDQPATEADVRAAAEAVRSACVRILAMLDKHDQLVSRQAQLEAREIYRSAECARVIEAYQVDQARLVAAEAERDDLREFLRGLESFGQG